MVQCAAFGCKKRSDKYNDVKFFFDFRSAIKKKESVDSPDSKERLQTVGLLADLQPSLQARWRDTDRQDQPSSGRQSATYVYMFPQPQTNAEDDRRQRDEMRHQRRLNRVERKKLYLAAQRQAKQRHEQRDRPHWRWAFVCIAQRHSFAGESDIQYTVLYTVQ